MDTNERLKKRIGEILIEEGCLNRQGLEKALAAQKKEGGLLGGLLVRLGLVTEEELTIAFTKQLGIPFIRLKNYRINPNALKKIGKEVCERYTLFPFELESKEISIAVTEPLDEAVLGELKKGSSLNTQLFLSTLTEVRECIARYCPSGQSAKGKIG